MPEDLNEQLKNAEAVMEGRCFLRIGEKEVGNFSGMAEAEKAASVLQPLADAGTLGDALLRATIMPAAGGSPPQQCIFLEGGESVGLCPDQEQAIKVLGKLRKLWPANPPAGTTEPTGEQK